MKPLNASLTGGLTLLDKIWEAHKVTQEPDRPAVLYIDLHLVHEVTSPQAFTGLREKGLKLRRPERTLATMDHSTPTDPLAVIDDQAQAQLETLVRNCEEFGVELHKMGESGHGIVHVIGPELGRTQPGMTIVCGDSHTATHGAFGALAFGIGTSEVEHVLATQCLLQRKPKSMEIRFEGKVGPGVTAKDLVLATIAEIGVNGGTGHVLEYRGEAIEALGMEGRMTVCNMSIEAGARAGMIAPDETTFEYLRGRPGVPADFEAAVEGWRQFHTDEGAAFDASVTIDATKIQPMITFGTHPGMGIPVSGAVPASGARLEAALEYMGLQAGQPMVGQAIDVVFLGSCTNSRITDLRAAAGVLAGRKVAEGVRMLVVPGSHEVKKAAEAEGLDAVFRDAGAEWREPGCSMCIAMNGDQLSPGQYAVSTSNRNFEGRQGPGGRTFLASPLTAAACAVAGRVTDPRTLMEGSSPGASR